MKTTQAQIEELKRLLEEATPGPWEMSTTAIEGFESRVESRGNTLAAFSDIEENQYHNAMLSCTLRNLAPSLLADLEKLQKERDEALAIMNILEDEDVWSVMIYRIRESEGLGWDGPRVTAWGKAHEAIRALKSKSNGRAR